MTMPLAQVRRPAIVRPEAHFGFSRSTYRAEGKGDHGADPDPYHEANQSLARRMWEVIQLHYPGQPLTTGANHAQGVAMIYFPIFTKWPYIIKINNLKADPGMRRVVRAAGEILERYRVPRMGFTTSDLVSALDKWQPRYTSSWKPPE
jgi:hypothetical protein